MSWISIRLLSFENAMVYSVVLSERGFSVIQHTMQMQQSMVFETFARSSTRGGESLDHYPVLPPPAKTKAVTDTVHAVLHNALSQLELSPLASRLFQTIQRHANRAGQARHAGLWVAQGQPQMA